MDKREEERLYFIVRSILLSCIAALQFLILTIIFGYIDPFRVILFGMVVFIISLAISRVFEGGIDRVVIEIMKILKKYPRIKNFILKYF
ncbi:MAG: hypothetical protein QMD14_05175 [Candidatus Aenigmarchaeota archaeon]|nr:hypothetical protein [Candidatus Aenigmarchaeota archaeon]